MIVLKKELCIRGFIHRRRRDLQAAEAKLEERDRLVSAIITIYLKWATYTLDGSIIEMWGFLWKALVLRRVLLMVVRAPSFIYPRQRHLRISVPHRRRWQWYARGRRRCLEDRKGVYSRAAAVDCCIWDRTARQGERATTASCLAMLSRPFFPTALGARCHCRPLHRPITLGVVVEH